MCNGLDNKNFEPVFLYTRVILLYLVMYNHNSWNNYNNSLNSSGLTKHLNLCLSVIYSVECL